MFSLNKVKEKSFTGHLCYFFTMRVIGNEQFVKVGPIKVKFGQMLVYLIKNISNMFLA